MNTTEDYWKRACEQETTIAVQAAEIERLRYLAKAMDNVAQHNGVIVDQWKARATAAEAERDALRERISCAADMAEDMWWAPQGSLWNCGTTPSAHDRAKWEGVKETAQGLLAVLDPDRYRAAMAKTEGFAMIPGKPRGF